MTANLDLRLDAALSDLKEARLAASRKWHKEMEAEESRKIQICELKRRLELAYEVVDLLVERLRAVSKP